MPELEFRQIDLRQISELEARAVNNFLNISRAEVMPEDPETPLATRLLEWQNIPMRYNLAAFAFFQASCVVAFARISCDQQGENQHLCGVNLEVLPEWRRKGLGMQLLKAVLTVAKHQQRRILILDTSDQIPAGAYFAEKIGSIQADENHTNRLLLEELDTRLLEAWITNAPSEEFELGFYTNGYPESELEALCELFEIMNSAPHGQLEINAAKTTPHQLLERERFHKAQGIERWTVFVRERSTRRYAGYSTVAWQASRPLVLGQRSTAVDPKYRGKGLGKWLKAVMLEKVMRERPEVNQIRTINADSNELMLRINHAMGFKPFIARIDWKLEVETACQKLGL